MASNRPDWAKKYGFFYQVRKNQKQMKMNGEIEIYFYGNNFSWKKSKHLGDLSDIWLLTLLTCLFNCIDEQMFPENALAVNLCDLQFLIFGNNKKTLSNSWVKYLMPTTKSELELLNGCWALHLGSNYIMSKSFLSTIIKK